MLKRILLLNTCLLMTLTFTPVKADLPGFKKCLDHSCQAGQDPAKCCQLCRELSLRGDPQAQEHFDQCIKLQGKL